MGLIVLVSLLVLLLVDGAKGDTALELMLQALGPDFSDFAVAAATDLDSPDIPGQYTLFAPTNTAFEAKMACFNSSSVDHKYKQDVMKYHFINVSLTEEAIVAVVGNRVDYTWQPFTLYNHQQLNVTLTNSRCCPWDQQRPHSSLLRGPDHNVSKLFASNSFPRAEHSSDHAHQFDLSNQSVTSGSNHAHDGGTLPKLILSHHYRYLTSPPFVVSRTLVPSGLSSTGREDVYLTPSEHLLWPLNCRPSFSFRTLWLWY